MYLDKLQRELRKEKLSSANRQLLNMLDLNKLDFVIEPTYHRSQKVKFPEVQTGMWSIILFSLSAESSA